MDVYEIEKIVRKGGSSLAEALHEFWPVISDTDDDMSETNTTLHLGHALIKAGFSVYAEHPFEMGEEKKKCRLDLLALNYKEETQLRIKAKVDLDDTTTDSDDTTIDDIHQNLKEIKYFKLKVDSNYDYEHYSNNEFGIIICTSWDSAFIEWWEDPEAEFTENPDPITKKKAEEIGELITRSLDRSKKGTGDCASGTYPLENSEMNRGDDAEDWPIHGMQYLIFELNNEIKKLLPKN